MIEYTFKHRETGVIVTIKAISPIEAVDKLHIVVKQIADFDVI